MDYVPNFVLMVAAEFTVYLICKVANSKYCIFAIPSAIMGEVSPSPKEIPETHLSGISFWK